MSNTDKKTDYLEVDETIPGQNYVCLSFISPETLIQNKEAFKCVKFLQSYCKDKNLKFDEVYSSYQDFTYKHEDKLQRDFDEKNDFQTSIRGLKVRGVYDTRGAADARAKKLSLVDSGFHTFVGQVGYWLPWDPNADKVSDEVFNNSQLNDMMEKYQENNVNRDIFYEEQKRDKIRQAREEVIAAEKLKEEEAEKEKEKGKLSISEHLLADVRDSEPSPYGSIVDDVSDNDVDDVVDDVDDVGDVDDDMKKGSEVSGDLKASLESDDPWVQRKNTE